MEQKLRGANVGANNLFQTPKTHQNLKNALGPKVAETIAESSINVLKPRGHVSDYVEFSESSMAAYVSSELGVSSERALEYVNAVVAWGGSYYGWICWAQQSKLDNEKHQKWANDLEDYVSRAPKWNAGVTYRGVQSPQGLYEQLAVGQSIKMDGLSSWSSKRGIANKFAEANKSSVYSVIYKTESKSQSMGTSTKHLASHKNEEEVLVSSKQSYEIVAIKEDRTKNVKVVTLREL